MSHYSGQIPATPRAKDWRDSAACRTEDPEIFFASGLTAAGQAAIRHAKVVCWACPSMELCGQWALETRQPFGVFGGMTHEERRTILRKRGIRITDTDPEDEEPAVEEAPRNRGGRPRAECGTPSAYNRHVRFGEPIDDACREAHTASVARYRSTGSRKQVAV